MKTEITTAATPVKTGWKCIDDRTLTADMLRRDKEAQEVFINALIISEKSTCLSIFKTILRKTLKFAAALSFRTRQ